MTGEAASVLARVDAAGAGTEAFSALVLAGSNRYMVGRTPGGQPCLLVAAQGSGRTVPLRLANIEAAFAVPCRVQAIGTEARSEILTVVSCTSPDPAIRSYFVGLLDLLVDMLGPSPTLVGTADGIERLVALLDRLRVPARGSVSGLVGELCVIAAARDPGTAVAAWRADPDEVFDFVDGELRLEAKATGGDRRVHSLSFEQANPPPGTTGLLASVLVRPAAGGTSVDEFLVELERRMPGHGSVLRLRTVVAETLGDTLPAALSWRFDRDLAAASLAFFDMRSVPAVRGPLPSEVSGVRFTTDLNSQAALPDPAWSVPGGSAILPLHV